MNIDLPTYDQEFVETLIPQKKPFVMVDSLLSFNENSVKSAFTPKENNIFIQNGVFQAAGILEHQAQSVALHTGYQFYLLKKEAPVGYIGAVKFFEIENLPKLHEKLITEVEIINELMGVTLVKTITKTSDKIIAISEMKTVLK